MNKQTTKDYYFILIDLFRSVSSILRSKIYLVNP